jgi:hypothetical protein
MKKNILQHIVNALGILLLIMAPIHTTTSINENYLSSRLTIKKINQRKKQCSICSKKKNKKTIPQPLSITFLQTVAYRYLEQTTFELQ